VRELQENTITKGDSSRKHVPTVSSRQFPRQSRQFDLTSNLLKGTSKFFLQEMSNKYQDQDYRGPASSQAEERNKQVYWTVWIQWSGTSDPQEHKALVDTSSQGTLISSSYKEAELICISEVLANPNSYLYWRLK